MFSPMLSVRLQVCLSTLCTCLVNTNASISSQRPNLYFFLPLTAAPLHPCYGGLAVRSHQDYSPPHNRCPSCHAYHDTGRYRHGHDLQQVDGNKIAHRLTQSNRPPLHLYKAVRNSREPLSPCTESPYRGLGGIPKPRSTRKLKNENEARRCYSLPPVPPPFYRNHSPHPTLAINSREQSNNLKKTRLAFVCFLCLPQPPLSPRPAPPG